jgi:hypothetical protein
MTSSQSVGIRYTQDKTRLCANLGAAYIILADVHPYCIHTELVCSLRLANPNPKPFAIVQST